MKKKPQDRPDWHKQRIEDLRKKHNTPAAAKDGTRARSKKAGLPESTASRSTFSKRTKKPRGVGLANEARPGLGTRSDDPNPDAIPKTSPKEAKSDSKPQATPHGYEEPRPEPREQAPDSMAHEQERSSGVSGHSGNE
jgi:hypothetical protein